jgi:undecaprenyl-diphosphatase
MGVNRSPVLDTRAPRPLVAGGAALAVASGAVLVLAVRSSGELSWWKAAVLGVVEGITEFLPVSSTGHLTVVARLLGLDDGGRSAELVDSYTIAIQAGAILAVLGLYHQRVTSLVRGLRGGDPEGRAVLVALVVAFLPFAAVGFLLGDTVKDRLFGFGPVAVAWVVGGVAILAFERYRPTRSGWPLERITPRQALIIGVAQSLALWPGVSRSLVTLLAALLVGLRLSAAVEFSFLLGAMTLGSATIYEAAGNGPELIERFGWGAPLLGLLTAFISAALAVKWLVGYLNKHDLGIFGWYRIIIGTAVLAALAVGLL